MLDMLMTDAPIVTRTQGLSGLPASLRDQFDVADDEVAFANAILHRLASPEVDLASRAVARRQIGVDTVRDALAQLKLD